MATPTTNNVYVHVIQDVINKVREEFVDNGGPGEGVLTKLQGIWELKMMEAGAILSPIDRSSGQRPGGSSVPVHDLNVPYEGTEEYETPTADMLFPPTPMPGMAQTPLPGTGQTPLPGTAQTPLPGTVENSFYNIPTGGTPITPNDYSSVSNTGGAPELKPGHGRPNSYMQPPSPWLSQRPPLDVNVAFVEGREESERGVPQPMTQDFFMMTSAGKRKRDEFSSQYPNGGFIPQQDGTTDDLKAGVPHGRSLSRRIPQLDGPIPDPYDGVLSTPNIYNYQEVVNEDYNIVNTPTPNDIQVATPAPAPLLDPVNDEEDEPLNEDDDDDLDDEDEGEDLNTTHLVLAQFDKVTRAKNRWKCTLKDGVMHINNKDMLFNKANGEFEF